jgi:hypothetical protein
VQFLDRGDEIGGYLWPMTFGIPFSLLLSPDMTTIAAWIEHRERNRGGGASIDA